MGEFMEDILRFFGAVLVLMIWMGLTLLISMAMHGGWFTFVMTAGLLPLAWVLIRLALRTSVDRP
jgi:hypothetical protein